MAIHAPSLTYDGRTFLWHGGFETKDLPKQAGFRWDSARKYWWTTDTARAQRLSAYADETARQAFAGASQAIEASHAEDADVEIPCPDGIAYLPYQKAGIAYSLAKFGYDIYLLPRISYNGDREDNRDAYRKILSQSRNDGTSKNQSSQGERNESAEESYGDNQSSCKNTRMAGESITNNASSNASSSHQRETFSRAPAYASERDKFQRGQWTDTCDDSTNNSESTRTFGIHQGISYQNKESSDWRESANVLQSGFRPSLDQESDRSGWAEPQTKSEAIERSKERQSAYSAWMDHIADQTLKSDTHGVLIGDSMGLGKTIEALGIANATDAKSLLIICPASLRLNWQREGEKWLCRSHVWHVVQGGEDIPPEDATAIIVNYDVCSKKAIKDALMARCFDLMIVDEAHYLKSGDKVQRGVAVLGKVDRKNKMRTPGLVDRATRLVFLTGTPILNKPLEVWPLANALAPSTFNNFFMFAKRYCNAHQISAGRQGPVWDFTGASHLDELQTKLRATCMVRRLKKDVLPELPPKRRQIIELPQNGARHAVQAEVAAWDAREAQLERLRAEVALTHAGGDEDAYVAAVERLRSSMRVAFEAIARLRHETAVHKAPKVAEHVITMLESGVAKLVLFAHHHDVIAILRDALTAAGYRLVIVTGDTPLTQRQTAVDTFQTEAAVQVFLGNIQAAGLGITLKAASTVVFAELDWTPAAMTQAEDRTHRIGQTESVLVQHLVYDGSLDARMAKLLLAKQAIADAALDSEPLVPTAAALSESPTAAQAQRPRVYPTATAAQREASLAGVQLLTALNPDGTTLRNAVGWNAIDAHVGTRLAACDTLTDGQVWLATKVLSKYRQTQLPLAITAILWPEASPALVQGESV